MNIPLAPCSYVHNIFDTPCTYTFLNVFVYGECNRNHSNLQPLRGVQLCNRNGKFNVLFAVWFTVSVLSVVFLF